MKILAILVLITTASIPAHAARPPTRRQLTTVVVAGWALALLILRIVSAPMNAHPSQK